MAWKRKAIPETANVPKRPRLAPRLPKNFVKRSLQGYSLPAMLPNIATVLALCTGLSAVRFALLERWEWCVIAILMAGVLDTIDGRLARFFDSTSRFGAELDSLSDFISFGISPALVMYFFTLSRWDGFGWAFVLLFSVCMALRLARFNTHSIEGTTPAWSAAYSTGIPAPAAAALAISPLVMSMEWPYDFLKSPSFSGFILFAVALLMISQIPTFLLKTIHIPHKYVLPLMIIIAVSTAALFSKPWLTLTFVAIGYISTFPFSIAAYCRDANIHNSKNKAVDKKIQTAEQEE
jgi:CDP-diacylglycerol--serine O-phosphatidyltransferase